MRRKDGASVSSAGWPCSAGAFEPRIDDAVTFARDNRVLLLKTRTGVGLDIALAGMPFEEAAIPRASPFLFPPDVSLRTCSAEDLVVLKAFARNWHPSSSSRTSPRS